MPTLEELKRTNERLRNELNAKKELITIGKERQQLIKQGKQLEFLMKHPGIVRFGGIPAKVGKSIGKAGLKYGGIAGKKVLKWAERVAENERRLDRKSASKRTCSHKRRK
jgi:hypothetical protein